MIQYPDLNEAEKAVVDAWLDANEHEYCCCDNHRYAHKGNAAEEEAYNAQAAQGCCGFCDVELPLPDGSILMYGFNHGH